LAKRIDIEQPEKHNPFWRHLLGELAPLYEGELDIVFPTEWNKNYYTWFHNMELAGFRWELHYSFEEISKLLVNPDIVFWFVTEDNIPQIIFFGYSIPEDDKKSFYLDTFAVKQRGKGIGNIIVDFMVRWAKTKHYKSVTLDTELKDEKGVPLKQFYEKHGFTVVASFKNGDLLMKRML
jgi:GNAT superfamily N-acetyltransferase